MTEAEIIAAGLTEAQRAWMLSAYEIFGALHTFPPANTFAVLKRTSLMKSGGELTPLGLEVRKVLEGRHS